MNKFLIEAKLIDGTLLTATTKPYKGTAARQWASARQALQKLIAGRPYDNTHITILPENGQTVYRRRVVDAGTLTVPRQATGLL